MKSSIHLLHLSSFSPNSNCLSCSHVLLWLYRQTKSKKNTHNGCTVTNTRLLRNPTEIVRGLVIHYICKRMAIGLIRGNMSHCTTPRYYTTTELQGPTYQILMNKRNNEYLAKYSNNSFCTSQYLQSFLNSVIHVYVAGLCTSINATAEWCGNREIFMCKHGNFSCKYSH